MLPRHLRRSLPAGLAVLVTAAGLSVLAPPANAAATDVRINEVESNGDTVGDFTELVNTGATPVDISGLRFRDDDPMHAFYVVPSGTVLSASGTAGSYFVITEAAQGFGLGAPDSVTLYLADATTVVDTYAWTAHAATTYGRCPDATGPLVTTAASTRGAANACPPPTSPVKLNEVESDDGASGDWVELYNTGSNAVDVSGYVFKDNVDTDVYTIPAGTTVAAGGYLVLNNPRQFGFGLGGGDSVRLYLPGEATPYDSYTWTAHATTTYGRCPNGTGAFATTASPTKGGPNSCLGDPVTGAWPGGSTVTTVDSPTLKAQVTSNLSGLAYEGTGTATTGTLWAVQNGPGTLFKLQKAGSSWTQASGDWAAGKVLRYPSGSGNLDAEGVTLTDQGSAGGVFVSTERDNDANSTSRPSIQRFDVSATGTSLTATRDWNLTGDLPALGPNLGLEGIAWVPDSYLVASGFKDQARNAAYDPSVYADHGTGLFFVGVEQNGMVYAYALNQTADTYVRVASFASGFPAVMELSWEPETQRLWVVCDDTCQGRSSRFGVNASGFFAPTPYVDRPAGLGNFNDEGFTTTPRSECVNGLKPVFWADDGDTDGFSLRQGTLSCTPPAAPPVVPPVTPPVAVPADVTGPLLSITKVKAGKVYGGKAPKPRCAATDVSGVATCTLKKKRVGLGGGRTLITVKATAVDTRGNATRSTTSYVVVRRS